MKLTVMRAAIAGSLMVCGSLAGAATGDAIAGKEKAALCRGCHGDAGVSVIADYPKLAGQSFAYLVKQLIDFQMQNRNDARMSPIAAGMSNAQDIRDIAAFFAALPPMKGRSRPNVAVGNRMADVGRKIFENGVPERGVPSCASCHGADGRGGASRESSFPVIGGQHKKYALKQLSDFESGKRTTDPSGAMEQIAKALSAFEIEAVAEYAAGL